MPKKVLILTQNFYPAIGSAGNRMKNIFQLLSKADVQVEVLTIEPSYPNKNMYKDRTFWDDEDVNKQTDKITRLPIKSRKFTNKLISRLFFYLEIMYRFIFELWRRRKDGYDYLYVSTPPIFIVFSAWLLRRPMKAKIILEVRDLWPDSLTGVKSFDQKWIIRFFQFVEKKMYHMADLIVINSKGFASHIQEKLKKQKKIVFLPNGPRQKELIEKSPLDEEFRVVYAGNLGLAQDIDRLKQVAQQLHEHGIHFDVLGYGMKTKEFKQFLTDKQLTNVQVHKPTTRRKSLELIRKSHVSIAFLNDVEVFSTVLPGKVLDYMTCQTPIVAGVKGIAADLIRENQTGYAFSSNDTTLMLEKVLELKEDQELLARMQANCLTTVTKHFLWEHNIERLVDIIE
ncbi:glycosyltransferase family 4 protein [Gracilibacillus dipsosauri]|uniref:Glycosyltransferase WbuB n=1 Tax=Gracilibacillus dipsosauri TaxID=178340 RepID=A0A317KUG7_9BACI|nr:glycosyltransferase family 4 protein [Gracilibacillus dipsosauri]PWU67127.1 glycosyltransferase WbuB [Gracilibacillus dipsosauri]